MDLIKFLFLPIQSFIWHPERIAVVSIVFLLCFFGVYLFSRKCLGFQHWLLLACAGCWGLFAIWEAYCKAMEYDIRVDLLLIYPALMSFSIFSIIVNIVSSLSNFLRKQRDGKDKNA